MSIKELLGFIFYITLLTYAYVYFEDIRYEIYLDIGIVDSVYYYDVKSIYLLTTLHIIILFFMGYNREKLYRI